MTIPGQLIDRSHKVFTVAVMILMTGAFLSFLIDPDDLTQVNAGSPVMKIMWVLSYLVALGGIFPRRQEAKQLILANRPLVLFVVWLIASTSWSINAATSLHAAAILTFSALFALDLSLRYSLKQQLQLLWFALMFVLLASVFVELFFPGIVPGGTAESVSAWHGVFGRKNELGRIICLSVIVSLTLVERPYWKRVSIFTIGIGLALLSRSVSAVGYVALMCGIIELFAILKWRPTPKRIGIFLVTLGVSVASYFIFENLAQITEMMGKDPHLTGRVDLWKLAISDIEKSPVRGYGYQAFWIPESPLANRIRQEINWDIAPHSHNGYIDLTLGVGLTGLALYGYFMLNATRRALLYFDRGKETCRAWPLSYLAFISLYQLTETTIIQGNTLFWLILCMIAFSIPSLRAANLSFGQPAVVDLAAARKFPSAA